MTVKHLLEHKGRTSGPLIQTPQYSTLWQEWLKKMSVLWL